MMMTMMMKDLRIIIIVSVSFCFLFPCLPYFTIYYYHYHWSLVFSISVILLIQAVLSIHYFVFWFYISCIRYDLLFTLLIDVVFTIMHFNTDATAAAGGGSDSACECCVFPMPTQHMCVLCTWLFTLILLHMRAIQKVLVLSVGSMTLGMLILSNTAFSQSQDFNYSSGVLDFW